VSGFCLVHVRRFQISNWELIDTISLRQVFGPNADPTWWSLGADVEWLWLGIMVIDTERSLLLPYFKQDSGESV